MTLRDVQALDELYQRHVRAVFALARSLATSTAVAEDLTQDTFVKAFTKAAGVRLVDESALPWLLVTCRHLASNLRRKYRSECAPLDEGLPVADVASRRPEAIIENAFLSEALAEALSKLSAIDHRVVTLCLVEDATYHQAAELLGLSPASVRNRLFRSRQQLQRRLSNDAGARS